MPFDLLEDSHLPAVSRFNQRLAAGGSQERFGPGPSPFSNYSESGQSAMDVKKFILRDESGEMRAGYYLKSQPYQLGGDVVEIGNLQLPIAEGIVDRRYAALGIAIVSDALQRNPWLYSLGLGGTDQPYPRLLRALKWDCQPVPFFFRIVKPFRFARRIKTLRERPLRRLLLDLAAFTGLGWAAVKARDLLTTRPAGDSPGCEDTWHFDSSVDQLWEKARRGYGFTAVRSAGILNFLYRAETFHRLLLRRGSDLIGWAVCLDTSFEQHKQFGNLRVGTVVDCFAAPERELEVLTAATGFLTKGVSSWLCPINLTANGPRPWIGWGTCGGPRIFSWRGPPNWGTDARRREWILRIFTSTAETATVP